jgi:hypothetical protein
MDTARESVTDTVKATDTVTNMIPDIVTNLIAGKFTDSNTVTDSVTDADTVLVKRLRGAKVESTKRTSKKDPSVVVVSAGPIYSRVLMSTGMEKTYDTAVESMSEEKTAFHSSIFSLN